jgi:hypothetical protein
MRLLPLLILPCLIVAHRAHPAEPLGPPSEFDHSISGRDEIFVHSNGHLTQLTADDRSTVVVFRTAIIDRLVLNHFASARVDGGRVGRLELNDHSSATIVDGSVGGAPPRVAPQPGTRAIVATGESRLSIEGGEIRGEIHFGDNAIVVICGRSYSSGLITLTGSRNAQLHLHADSLNAYQLPTSQGMVIEGQLYNERFKAYDKGIFAGVDLRGDSALHLHRPGSPTRSITAVWLNAENRRRAAEAAMNAPPPANAAIVIPYTTPPRLLLAPLAFILAAFYASTSRPRRAVRPRLVRAIRAAAAILCAAACIAVGVWISRPHPEFANARRTDIDPPHWFALAVPAAFLAVLVIVAIWRRRLVALFALLTLVLLTATLALWVRSYRHHDQLAIYKQTRLAGEFRGNIRLRTTQIRSSAGGLGVFTWTQLHTDEHPASTPPHAVHASWEDMRVRPDHPWTAPLFWGPGTRARRWGIGVQHHTYPITTSPPFNTHRTTVVLPYWAISLPLATPLLLITLRAARRHHRLARQKCPTCAYDLRATPDRCPECGTLIPAT